MKYPKLHSALKILPTDYTHYGGQVERWKDPNKEYPDCSCGCKHFVKLGGNLGKDWGVCANTKGPRKGLLTWEHMAGFECFEPEDENE
jgi:hypothetical protein